MLTHLSGIWTKLVLTLQRDWLPQQSKSRVEAMLIQFIKSSSFNHLLLLESRGKFALGPRLIISVSGMRRGLGRVIYLFALALGLVSLFLLTWRGWGWGARKGERLERRRNGNWVQSNRRRALFPPSHCKPISPSGFFLFPTPQGAVSK